MKKHFFTNLLKLIASIVLCQGAGIIGSLFTISSVDSWYRGLNKPVFTPPSRVFSPVWISLYVLMGISMFIIWRNGLATRYARRGMLLFIVQLALNSIWSYAFFGIESPLAGLIVIVVLWMFIFLTINDFRKVSMLSAVLLLPYIIWVSFAAVLNFSIFLLN
jgi:tryptophan-rich sensory protein